MAPKKKAAAPVEAVEPSETEQAVTDTAAQLADAQEVLAAAQQQHEEAKAAHATATAPPKPVAEKQCLIEGSMVPVDLPDLTDGPFPRRILLSGINYEHVSEVTFVGDDEQPYTIWVYRRM